MARRTATTANAILGLLALRDSWSARELTRQLATAPRPTALESGSLLRVFFADLATPGQVLAAISQILAAQTEDQRAGAALAMITANLAHYPA